MFKKTLKKYTIALARMRSHFLLLCCALYFMHIVFAVNKNYVTLNRIKLLEGGLLTWLDEAREYTLTSVSLIVFILN